MSFLAAIMVLNAIKVDINIRKRSFAGAPPIPTNRYGIYATCTTSLGGGLVFVTVHFSTNNSRATGLFPTTYRDANDVRQVDNHWASWRFFESTNSFIGFVDLRGPSGKKVNLIHPEVNFVDQYPPAFDLEQARSNSMAWNEGLDYVPFPHPLIGSNSPATFRLQDYFRLKDPGTYSLTVWPMIYERSATNANICNRIDLQPANAQINWDGKRIVH